MKINELRQKSKEELKTLLDQERQKLVQFRFNIASGKEKNVKEARMIRKNIARLLTVVGQLN